MLLAVHTVKIDHCAGAPHKHNISWLGFHLALTQRFTSKQISEEICVQCEVLQVIKILQLSFKSINLYNAGTFSAVCTTLSITWMPNMQRKYHWKWDTLKKCSLGCEFICSVPMISISCASCMGKGWKRELLNRVENNSNVLMYSTAVYPNYIYLRTVSSSLLFSLVHSIPS